MREGPLVTVSHRCTGCRWLKGESYAVQGDSGTDYYCTHVGPDGPRKTFIGDTRTDTPDWCPVLREDKTPKETS